MRCRLLFLLLGTLLGNFALADTLPIHKPGRGESLYETHCIACHSAQVHWREQKLATDWNSLQAQVRRWERFLGLKWNVDDVLAVSRYLNTLHYHYPAPD